jgi:hypothetical protein
MFLAASITGKLKENRVGGLFWFSFLWLQRGKACGVGGMKPSCVLGKPTHLLDPELPARRLECCTRVAAVQRSALEGFTERERRVSFSAS